MAPVLYKVSTAGTLVPVATFTNQSHVGIPNKPFLASDGNFYLSSETGGLAYSGLLFQETPTGGFESLSVLSSENLVGYDPLAPLTQASDGNFYGDTESGAENGTGSVFVLYSDSLPAPIQLTFSDNPSTTGSPVTLNWKVLNAFSDTMQQCYAFVQGSQAGAGTWTGKQSGTYNSSTKQYSGSATITPTAAGTYTYALTCGGVESGFATLTVTAPKVASSTTLTATPNPATVGQTVTLKAVVAGPNGTPAGTITFSIDGSTITTADLVSGSVLFPVPTSGLPLGTYPLVAAYSGNSSYDSSVSPTYNAVINAAPTTTTLQANPNPVTPPASVTFTATVKRSASGASGTPAGSVGFYFGSNLLDTATVNAGGVATFTVSTSGLPAGSYPLTAKYLGDGSDVASVSQAVTAVVK